MVNYINDPKDFPDLRFEALEKCVLDLVKKYSKIPIVRVVLHHVAAWPAWTKCKERYRLVFEIKAVEVNVNTDTEFLKLWNEFEEDLAHRWSPFVENVLKTIFRTPPQDAMPFQVFSFYFIGVTMPLPDIESDFSYWILYGGGLDIRESLIRGASRSFLIPLMDHLEYFTNNFNTYQTVRCTKEAQVLYKSIFPAKDDYLILYNYIHIDVFKRCAKIRRQIIGTLVSQMLQARKIPVGDQNEIYKIFLDTKKKLAT